MTTTDIILELKDLARELETLALTGEPLPAITREGALERARLLREAARRLET
jgi:hypothetical protein